MNIADRDAPLAKNAPDLKVILPPDWAIIIGFKVSDFDPDQIL